MGSGLANKPPAEQGSPLSGIVAVGKLGFRVSKANGHEFKGTDPLLVWLGRTLSTATSEQGKLICPRAAAVTSRHVPDALTGRVRAGRQVPEHRIQYTKGGVLGRNDLGVMLV